MAQFQLESTTPWLLARFSQRSNGNMAPHLGSSEETHRARRLFLQDNGIPDEKTFHLTLTHSTKVLMAKKTFAHRGIAHKRKALIADAVIVTQPDLYAMFFVGDCLSIIVVDPDQRHIGIAHAGWKGTEMHIVEKLITRMKKNGSNVGRLQVELGPAIGPCCFHFHNPIQEHLSGWEPYLKKRSNGFMAIDFIQYNKDQLLHSGIPIKNIRDPHPCTSCRSDQFFSHYRDTREERSEGRFMIVVGIK